MKRKSRLALYIGAVGKSLSVHRIKETIQGAHLMPSGADFDALVGALLGPFQSASMSMTLCDASVPDTPIIQVNEAFCELTGYRESDVVGRNCRFMQGPSTDLSQVARMRRAIARGEPCRSVLWNCRRDGSPFLNEVIITPVRDATGKLRLFKGLQREVTEGGLERTRIRFTLLPDASLRPLAAPRGAGPEWMEHVQPRDLARLRNAAAYVAAKRDAAERLIVNLDFVQPDGSIRTHELTAAPSLEPGLAADDAVVFDGALCETARTSGLDARLRLLETAAAQGHDGIMITEAEPVDWQGPRIIYINEAVTRQTGYSATEMIGRSPRMLQGPDTDRAELARVGDALRQWLPVTTQLLNYRRDGSTFWSELSITPVADSYGWWTHWVSIHRDITERRAALQRIEFLALHDPLTGLGNRRLVTSWLERALRQPSADGSGCGVVRLDLDRFKSINDTFGHAAGDAVLVETGRRLRASARISDIVARVGGDEFLVIMPEIGGHDDLAAAAERVHEAVTGPFAWDNHRMHILTSVGAAFYPRDGDTIEDLLAAADISLYRSKAQGRGRTNVFSPSLREQAAARKQLGEALRIGLERNEFEPFFQPQLHIPDRSLVGAEALVRWRHPERGVLAPAAFMEYAEEAGLMAQLDECVAERSIAAAAAWSRAGLTSGVLAVNLSGESFANPHLAESLAARLAAHGVPPQRFAVEMVESAFIGGHATEVAAKLAKLRQLGIGIDLDDFGTGYASLTHLRLFQVDRIKLDASFIEGIGDDPDDDIIVTAIVRLAKSLGLRCVAEGVETQRQLDFLAGLGCDDVQGYLFARPMDERRMTNWLRMYAARQSAPAPASFHHARAS
jgi:diguanylate cyclase (GGDEF)-like protein/PAS domain S-box-containing protein